MARTSVLDLFVEVGREGVRWSDVPATPAAPPPGPFDRSSTPTRGVADLLNVSPRRAKREARRWLEAFSLPGASPRTPGGRQVAWLDGLFGETPGGSKRVDSPWNPFGETPKRDDSNLM